MRVAFLLIAVIATNAISAQESSSDPTMATYSFQVDKVVAEVHAPKRTELLRLRRTPQSPAEARGGLREHNGIRACERGRVSSLPCR
jgi:hypothetical protein